MKLEDLFESMTTAYPWNVVGESNNRITTTFTPNDGSQVVVEIERVIDDNAYNRETGEDTYTNIWDINFYRNDSTQVTGEGDAYAIFGTVMAIMKQYAAKYNMQYICFGSSKSQDSRYKLYTRLATRYAPQNGFKAIPHPAVNKEVPEEVRNVLKSGFAGHDIYLLVRQ